MKVAASYSFKEEIKAEADRLGFQKTGFAEIVPLEFESGYFKNWLDEGYHGSMSWLANSYSKRINPAALLPGAKSIIVVAINYFHPQKSIKDSVGRVSRYAWGNDYHVVVKEKLVKLWEFILTAKPDSKGIINVDSGPVMEKLWAKRAGIGWQGKHTLILDKDVGSWIFLGSIITDIKFDCDMPAEDYCGNCTLCIDSCPTNAIIAPYQLNASKCISYFTIEHSDDVSKDVVNKMGNWIFGCDVCQSVCPWNKNTPTGVAEFKPKEFSSGLEFDKVLAMSEDEFKNIFSNNPIRRRGLKGLVENVQRIYKKQ
ncbi:MAG: tRNA epoxyqueuosine(34) reductase QueG [Ignavibacteriales bacterium]|nr:tRNA epoxyqueuosine(34) reductase QueG [Ignavibacteriales bacterium]